MVSMVRMVAMVWETLPPRTPSIIAKTRARGNAFRAKDRWNPCLICGSVAGVADKTVNGVNAMNRYLVAPCTAVACGGMKLARNQPSFGTESMDAARRFW